MAVAYDNPVPGYDTYNTINLRLFRAAPSREFDLASFNTGDYMKAVRTPCEAEGEMYSLTGPLHSASTGR